MNKALIIQNRIECKLSRIHVSLSDYLFLLSVGFMMTGMVLFVYCIILGIPFDVLVWNSNPLFYLVTGVMLFVFYFLERRYGLFH